MPLTVEDVKDKATITAAEAAQLLDLSTQATYRAVRQGYLPNIRMGRKVVIPTKPLLQLLGHDDDEPQPDNVRELQSVGGSR